MADPVAMANGIVRKFNEIHKPLEREESMTILNCCIIAAAVKDLAESMDRLGKSIETLKVE